MSTKANIVSVAIALFNEKGIASVTMRQVAEAMAISPGNLTYHFKTREALMEVIYAQLHSESGNYISLDGYITLHDFEKILYKFYQLRQTYRFFFNDLVYIIRQFPTVAKMYQNANIGRFKQSRQLVNYYITSGRMIQEDEHVDYNKIIHSIWMINTFWPSQQQIMDTEDYPVNKTTPIAITWQMIYPYLTETGKEEYRQIRKFSNTVNN
ncbi:MAG: TetR/AcrR family transcriptional regulator [Cyclobacteriaceae bacterium]